jgi:hypothetical protein
LIGPESAASGPIADPNVLMWYPTGGAGMLLHMPWEVFKRQRAPLSKDPFVTVQKRGTISINEIAHSALGSPDAVELLFDQDERLIGIRKVNPGVEHAYPVRPLGANGRSFLIAGNAFTQYYGIEATVARRRPARLIDDVLVVDLKDPGTEIVSNRNLGKKRQAAQQELKRSSANGGQEPGSASE